MDRDGVILDTAFSEADLSSKIGGDWIGRRWVTTVSPDSRQKIEEMLGAATPTALARWRQVNHPTSHGADIPVRYRIGRFGPNGRLLAVGRDLRPMAVLQQRLAETQQEMEREYIRIRNAEKRYRLLFQLSSEAVLIVDSNTSKIIEANPAALTFLGIDPKKLIGQAFESLVSESSRQVSQSFLSATRVAPRVDNVHVQLERDQRSVLLTGSLYRQDGAPHLVVLLSRLGEAAGATSNDDANILRLVEAIPEAFVVVDEDRQVVTANAAFLDLVQVTSLVQVRGEPVERWIGRQGAEVDVLVLQSSRARSRPPLFNCRAGRIRHSGRCGNRRRFCRRRRPQPAMASRSGRKDGEAGAKSSAAANFPARSSNSPNSWDGCP